MCLRGEVSGGGGEGASTPLQHCDAGEGSQCQSLYKLFHVRTTRSLSSATDMSAGPLHADGNMISTSTFTSADSPKRFTYHWNK